MTNDRKLSGASMTHIASEPITATDRYTDGRYLKKQPDWHVGDSPWKAAHVLAMLARHNLTPKTICDVGCGAGEILVQLHRHLPPDVRFTGFEVSPQAQGLCAARRAERLDYRRGDAFTAGEHYDLALMMDVVEHVEDSYGFLRKLRGLAEYKVMHIPLDLSAYAVLGPTLMRGRESIGHIHYYTRATALALLRETGYDVLDSCYTFGAIYSPGQRGRSLPATALRLARHAVFLLNKELCVRLLGGASLLVLAK
jgi:Methyltransferase domain